MSSSEIRLVPVPSEIASEPASGECIVSWFWVEAGGNLYCLETKLFDTQHPHVVKSPYVLPYASPNQVNADVFAQEVKSILGIEARVVLKPVVYIDHFQKALLKVQQP